MTQTVNGGALTKLLRRFADWFKSQSLLKRLCFTIEAVLALATIFVITPVALAVGKHLAKGEPFGQVMHLLWQGFSNACKALVSVVTIVALISATTWTGPLNAAEPANAAKTAEPFRLLSSGLVTNDAAPAMIEIHACDIAIQSIDMFGQGIMIMNDGTFYKVAEAGDNIYLTTLDGVNYVVPKFVVECILIIAGGVIIVGGAVLAYKIYKCADRWLTPPEPPPVTNAPPTNAPPSKKKGSSVRMSQSLAVGSDGSEGSFGPSLPEGYTVVMDTNAVWTLNVSNFNWVDWQGNPITGEYGQTVQSITAADADGVSKTFALQSSTNLVNWSDDSSSYVGWVSSVTRNMYRSFQTNMIVVGYDGNGHPYQTNWYSVSYDTSFKPQATFLGTMKGVPYDAGKRNKFWRWHVVQ